MKIIFIAGPYTGKTHFEVTLNIATAAKAAAELALHGYGFFCPHLHSAHFDVIVPEVPESFWRELGLKFLELCDGMLMVGEWQNSAGACAERDAALARGIPVYHSINHLLEANLEL